jgi:hypothetical protein
VPNNPPGPALEGLSPVLRTDTECKAIKKKYNVIIGKHTDNNKNPKKPKTQQSHHIFQNASMTNSVGTKIVTFGQAGAVVLRGGSHRPGSEHAIANDRQNARSRKGTKNKTPTMGDIRKAAKGDLVAAFRHGNPGRKKAGDSKKKFNKEMEILADCLIMEAEKAKEKNRKRDGKRPYKLTDDARTRPPKGCFASGTLVWLNRFASINVEFLIEGDKIETDAGQKIISHVKGCISYLIELDLGDESISLAPFHRVRLANGRYRCSDALRRGHVVDTSHGPKAIIGVKQTNESFPIYSFSLKERAACRIGSSGLWVETTETGYTISAHVKVDSIFSSGSKNKCQC